MYNIVELFSGIGSQAKALKNLDMVVDKAYTCEWDVHAFVAYDSIHNNEPMPADVFLMNKESLLKKLEGLCLSGNGKEAMDSRSLAAYPAAVLRRIYLAIQRNNNFVDVSALSGDRIPTDIDILTYSFPCQDLSNVGAFHGYNKGIDKDSGSRSSLLWQVGRILQEMKDLGKSLPRFLLMENVPALLSDRHVDNFKTWIGDLKGLGYRSWYYQLNASSFGLPQNRPRLLMLSVYTGDNKELDEKVKKYFYSKPSAEDIVSDYQQSPYFRQLQITDLLRIDYTNPVLFDEACECTPNNTVSRQKIWDENPQIIQEDGSLNPDIPVVRTITTKQDRNPNSGNLWFDSGIDGRSHFRYLTPRECFLFMGFTEEDFEHVIQNNPVQAKGAKFLPRDKLIRMAGNSIPVQLLEGVFYQVKLIDKEIFGNYMCT